MKTTEKHQQRIYNEDYGEEFGGWRHAMIKLIGLFVLTFLAWALM